MSKRPSFFTGCLIAQLIVATASFAGQAAPGDLELAGKPAIQEVRQAIDGMDSLKDYERLSWILTTIKQQDAADQNELLRCLDARIDALSAGPTVVAAANQPPKTAAAAARTANEKPAEAAPEAQPESGDDSAADEDMSQQLPRRNSSPEKDRQKYEQVRQQVEQIAFEGDFDSRNQAISQANALIMTVQNQEQREELGNQLSERFLRSVERESENTRSQMLQTINAIIIQPDNDAAIPAQAQN